MPSSPSPLFLLLKHLDISSLSQKDFDELIQVVQHAPMDPDEMVSEAAFRKEVIKKTLLDRALETMCPWGRTPKETENGLALVQALLERGVPASLTLSDIASQRMVEDLPLTLALVQHYQTPDAQPRLPSELRLGVTLLDALRKGGSSKECLKTLKDLVASSSVDTIEGLHPAVWMVLQSSPRRKEERPNSGRQVEWASAWSFEGSLSERKAFFPRILKGLEGWASTSLPATDPQLLLLDACARPWSAPSPGMEKRWSASSRGAQSPSEKVLGLVHSLPGRSRGQAVISLLGAAVALLENPLPGAEGAARVLINEGVCLSLHDPSCSAQMAGKALWGELKTGVKAAQVLAREENGVKEGLRLWARFIAASSISAATPTLWAAALLEAAENEGRDVSSQVSAAAPEVDSALEKASKIIAGMGSGSASSNSAAVDRDAAQALEKLQSVFLASKMGKELPPGSPRRTPGARF